MRKSTLAERRGPGLGLLILVAAAGAFSHAAQADPAVQPNFVQQSDSGRYFQLEDGSDFLPIGHNESWVAPGMRTLTVSSLYYDLQAAREYFNKLRNHGVNVIRIWVDMPTASVQWDGIALEKPAGQFDPEAVEMLDRTVQLADEYGVYLLLMPYDGFWMLHSNPQNLGYNDARLGGPIHTNSDWINSPASVEYHKARWRFLIDRYGWSSRIFAYDVMNEMDWDGSFIAATDAQALAYVTKMSAYIQQYERQRWGKNHLVTVSTVNPEPTGNTAYYAYKHPNIDFSCTHMIYEAMGSRTDTIAGCVRINQGLKYFFSQMPPADPRPYFTSEWWSTADNTFWDPLQPAFEDEQCHNVAWAHLASGGAGGGMYLHTFTAWSEALLDDYLAMSRIGRHIRWARFDSRNIDSRISVTGGDSAAHTIIRMGCSDNYTALVWLLQNVNASTGNINGASARVTGMTPGTYSCLFLNTRSGAMIAESTAVAIGGVIQTPIPVFDEDIALILKNQSADTPLNGKPCGYITAPEGLRGTAAGTITIAADAWDDTGISQVRFDANYNDGSGQAWREIGNATAPPYSIQWNASGLSDQLVELRIDLVDAGGRTVNEAHTITGVRLEHHGGDRQPPFASIESPGVDAVITDLQAVTLRAAAWDDSSGVSKVQFWTGPPPGGGANTLLGEVFAPPWELTVDLSPFDQTTRWFSVDIFDVAGNSARPSDLHANVIVDAAADVTPIVGHFLTPASGSIVSAASPTLQITAACNRESRVDRVTYLARYGTGAWQQVGTATTPPYTLDWTPNAVTNQVISLRMDVRDTAGRTKSDCDHVSGILYASPGGDTWGPWAHLASPAAYTTVDLPATLQAAAGDAISGVQQVTFKYQHAGTWNVIGTVNEPPYTLVWDPAGLPSGTVVNLALDVQDNAGNMVSTSDQQSGITLEAPAGRRADFDFDGDADQSDFGHLQACLAGPLVPPGSACVGADLDHDHDVDDFDVSAFSLCMTTANQPVDPGCME